MIGFNSVTFDVGVSETECKMHLDGMGNKAITDIKFSGDQFPDTAMMNDEVGFSFCIRGEMEREAFFRGMLLLIQTARPDLLK